LKTVKEKTLLQFCYLLTSSVFFLMALFDIYILL
jgi:hypothetical protein